MTENELALSYVDELKFSDFFALLRKNFGANPEISRLEQAFTLNKTDVDFLSKLKRLLISFSTEKLLMLTILMSDMLLK
jgi:hypothetical protein